MPNTKTLTLIHAITSEQSAYGKAWYQDHKDWKKDYNAKYYQQHKDQWKRYNQGRSNAAPSVTDADYDFETARKRLEEEHKKRVEQSNAWLEEKKKKQKEAEAFKGYGPNMSSDWYHNMVNSTIRYQKTSNQINQAAQQLASELAEYNANYKDGKIDVDASFKKMQKVAGSLVRQMTKPLGNKVSDTLGSIVDKGVSIVTPLFSTLVKSIIPAKYRV